MKLRLFSAGFACALSVLSPSPAKATAVAGLDMPTRGQPAAGDGCRASAALSSSSPTSWLPLLFAVGVVLVFVRRSA